MHPQEETMPESSKRYTRQGDDGTTALGRSGRVFKTAPSVAACGDAEEAELAIAAAISTDDMAEEFDALLRRIQTDLVAVRADLSTTISENDRDATQVSHAHVEMLEAACDRYAVERPHPRLAVSPGSSAAAGLLRLAVAVTRRAERSAWALLNGAPENTAKLPAIYLNRLSSLLLVVAERVDHEQGQRIPIGACGSPWPHTNAAPTG
jgi:cob(I)alamin adenosyltransferase